MEPEARFKQIEATLAQLAQAQLRGEYALTDAVEHMARGHKQLLTAQVGPVLKMSAKDYTYAR